MAGESFHIFNRSGNPVVDAWLLTEQISSPRWGSVLPGGYKTCEFTVPTDLAVEIAAKQAYRLSVKFGLHPCWDGRLSDMERQIAQASGGRVKLTAYGGWEHMKQRRTSYTGGATTYADTVIKAILPNCPQISTNLGAIQSPNFNLATRAWSRKDIQGIVNDLLKTGDDQTPPRQWYFAVWEAVGAAPVGSYDQKVSASANDAYSDADDSSASHNGTVFRMGKNSDNHAFTSGFIFSNVAVPRYAYISSATLYLHSLGVVAGSAGAIRSKVRGELTAAPADFTVSWPRTRTPLTTAGVDWDLSAWNSGTWYSRDVTSIVQELVNMATWVSGGNMDLINADDGTANGNRVQGATWDYSDHTYGPRLVIAFAAPEGQTMAFKPYFYPRPTVSRAVADYIISAEDVQSDLVVLPSVDELYNSVTAKYGGSSYTAANEDADSIDRYDKRENDADALDAGDSADVATANNVRDLFLDAHKDRLWRCNPIAVSRLRTRHGHVVPCLGTVRAGCIATLVDMPTFNDTATESRSFYIVGTEYDRDSKVLTLTPEALPDTIDILLAQE
jgi:hypothetical protein